MRRYPPSAAGLALICGLIAACGRLGFEPRNHPVGIDPSQDGPDASPAGDGDGDAPGDGDGDGDGDGVGDGDGDGDGDATGDGDGDAATPPADGGPLPIDDGGTQPGPDAGGEPDASNSPGVPAPIDCSSYSGVLACDPIDGPASGAAVTTFEYGDGNVALGAEYATATSSVDEARAALEARFGPFTSGELYLRYSLYVPASVTLRGLNIANIGDLDSDSDFGVDVNLESGNAIEFFLTGDGTRPNDTFVMPRDRWLCVLFKVENIDHVNGRASVLIDNVEALAATGIDTEPANGVRGAAAGIDWTYDSQGDTTLYIKNFLVTRSHPGDCP